MKYIRTKDGRIIDLTHWVKMPMLCIDKENNLVEEDICYQTKWFEKIGNGDACYVRSESISHKNQVLKQADTIEELICDDDILYIYDLYPDAVLVVEGNIKPFGYQKAIKLKEWLDYKPKFDLFIKDTKGNYIKRAKTNEKGELKLL